MLLGLMLVMLQGRERGGLDPIWQAREPGSLKKGQENNPNIAGNVAGIVAGDVAREGAWKFGSQKGRGNTPNIAGNVAGDPKRGRKTPPILQAMLLGLLLVLLQGREPGSLDPKWQAWVPGSFATRWGRTTPLILQAMLLGMLLAKWLCSLAPQVGREPPPPSPPQEPYPSRQYGHIVGNLLVILAAFGTFSAWHHRTYHMVNFFLPYVVVFQGFQGFPVQIWVKQTLLGR